MSRHHSACCDSTLAAPLPAPSTPPPTTGIFLPVIESVSAASGSYPGGELQPARHAPAAVPRQQQPGAQLLNPQLSSSALNPHSTSSLKPTHRPQPTHPTHPPDDEASRSKIGAYLIQSQLQASSHTCSLFLTASAQNLLCLQLAEASGVTIGNHFAVWSQGAIVPGVIGGSVRRVGMGWSSRLGWCVQLAGGASQPHTLAPPREANECISSNTTPNLETPPPPPPLHARHPPDPLHRLHAAAPHRHVNARGAQNRRRPVGGAGALDVSGPSGSESDQAGGLHPFWGGRGWRHSAAAAASRLEKS